MKKSLSFVLLFLLICTTVLFSADLKTYQSTYDKQMESIVLEHGSTISKLNESYKNALNSLNDRATKAGDLMKIKATMAEVERFNTDKMVTADDAKDSSSDLKKIQLSYMQNMESLETAKARKVVTLTSKFDSALAKLQKSLAQQGKIDDATSVMDERDNISKSEDVVSAKALIVACNKKDDAKNEKKVTPTKQIFKATSLTPADVECRLPSGINAGVVSIATGAKVNSDRDYVFTEMASELDEMQFLQLPHNANMDYKVKAPKASVLYLLLHSRSEVARYEKDGWKKTELDVKCNWSTPSFIVLSLSMTKNGYARVYPLKWISPIIVSKKLKIK